VLIFCDNDSDPATRFGTVRNLIQATDRYSIPDEPMRLGAAQDGKVRLMFVPLPGRDLLGGLETLLLQSAVNEKAALDYVAALVACAGCEGWTPSHDAKMRLRCLISVKCRGNSDMTLTNIWGWTGIQSTWLMLVLTGSYRPRARSWHPPSQAHRASK
jgi:hypothetical protein